MGMAAGQARLLSITSRMSDNELRAQLINNSKMRLATESSQVSESYVTALNDAQMMFTNYGANNTSSYQQLSFNALTKYNQYNNQYGLTSASGQILVSESDAKNYVNANGSLDRFLNSYGLTRDTTYFDNLKSKYTDKNGNVADIGYTPEELKAMYFGTSGYQGYQALLTSRSYFDYQDMTERLTGEFDALMEVAGDDIKNVVLNGANGSFLVNGEGFKTFVTNTTTNDNSDNNFNTNYYPGKISDFMTYLDDVSGKLASGSNNALYNQLKTYLGDTLNKYGLATPGTDGKYSPAGGKYNSNYDPVNGVSNVKDYSTVVKKDASTVDIILDGICITVSKSDSGYKTAISEYEPDPEVGPADPNTLGLTATISGNQLNISKNVTNEDDDGNSIPTSIPELKTSIDLAEIFKPDNINGMEVDKEYDLESNYTYYQSIIEQDLKLAFEYAAKTWESSYKYNVNPTMFNVPGTNKFMGIGKDLTQFLFGANALESMGGPVKESDYPSLMTVDGIHALMEAYPELKITEDFSNVLDLFTLENMMDLYGEPKVTWIDSTDTKGAGNAEKKAQWYTNLFTQMGNGVKNNFKTITNGLASSTEWIRFALESGMVSMLQVDPSNEWNTIMYSNVSDITEQTNDLGVTKAEAEYKRAMNKIESKDKQFDMELKNIDTEHNSLQTEYDSIKSAIDKNIERTFKMYS